MASSPYVTAFLNLRDSIFERKNHYSVNIMDSPSHYNYEINYQGGKIIWDDTNEIMYIIHATMYQFSIGAPITIAAIPYSDINCIEEFCKED